MQYFKDLSDNFEDIKKRKFVITEHTLSTPFLSITDKDSLLTVVEDNYKHILSKYRLDNEVYTSFFQTLITSKDSIQFANKNEEGILQGQLLSAKDNLISEAINNSLKCLLLTLSRERISTYEKTILTNTFCTLGPAYFGVYALGVEDLLFVFKDETNVFKSILNSISEKYRIEFKDYNLKFVLNFYCDKFFKNLQSGNNLTLQTITALYTPMINTFNMGCPVHISDLFYVDLINNSSTKYAIDLFKSYSDGLLAAKQMLGASVIDNDPARIGDFVSKTGTKTLENYFPRTEINEFGINNLGEVSFAYRNYLISDQISLGSKSFKDFVNLVSNKIEDLNDVNNSFFLRKFFNVSPDKLDQILSTFKSFADTLTTAYHLPFKASVMTKDETFVIEYPLKSLVQNVMEHMKRKCSYDEIYSNTYKSRIIILFEKFLELMEVNPITENFVKSKVIEFLFISKLQELLNKDSYNGKLLTCLLLTFISGNIKDGFLNVIKTTYDKQLYLFRNNDFLNSLLKPLLNGDPSTEILVKDNCICIRTYNLQAYITVSVSDLTYLQFNLYSNKQTLTRLNRYAPSPSVPPKTSLGKKQVQDRNYTDSSKKKESGKESKSDSNKPV